MGDSVHLSQPYDSVELAVKAGFKKVMANNNQQETKEFGFWVIMKVRDDKKGVQYFYTDLIDGGSGEVTLTLPVGLMVRAHCHTHPKRISTGDFGYDDKQSFKKLREVRPGIAWYLLNPQSEIRRANDENDFLAGTTIPW
jgi:hypothetical protein